MKIIIIGCGKVGRTLAQQLSEEQHDIVMVDTQPQKLQEFSEEVDAMYLAGNGASISIQDEAGIRTADIRISGCGVGLLFLQDDHQGFGCVASV